MAKFELDTSELERAKTWYEEHKNKFHNGKEPYAGAIGGNPTYNICHTGLGTIVSIDCSLCQSAGKEHKDYSGCLTDFSDW